MYQVSCVGQGPCTDIQVALCRQNCLQLSQRPTTLVPSTAMFRLLLAFVSVLMCSGTPTSQDSQCTGLADSRASALLQSGQARGHSEEKAEEEEQLEDEQQSTWSRRRRSRRRVTTTTTTTTTTPEWHGILSDEVANLSHTVEKVEAQVLRLENELHSLANSSNSSS